MTLLQALLYFLREAAVGLARSWKVSLLAVLTIALSLFLGGTVQLVTSNLSRAVDDWQRQARLTIYLRADPLPGEREALEALVLGQGLVASREEISAAEAVARFHRNFPSLVGLFSGLEGDPLPASWELQVDPSERGGERFVTWVASLRSQSAVLMVDDDLDWLDQAARLLGLVRTSGLALSALLLGAAVFTIASVVRLILLLYRDEIAVLRLVGATEFFVRGPFYAQGLLQGLLGALAALGSLALVRAVLLANLGSSLAADLLLARFLAPGQQALLVAIGALAGLGGAVLSVRREVAGRQVAD
ncbi:MAG: hypothetical protein KJ058_01020 [Thermoanaerobaculia bacterium]|nr:hypothetical protein [Thermoanaerobaculia bacterium]